MSEENQCKICGKILTTKYKLNAHMKKKIPCTPKMKEFKCEKCQKIFTTKQSLQIHTNKKNPCKIKKSNLELEIELEKIKLKQEIEKTKQEELKLDRTEKEINLRITEDIKNPRLLIETLNINIQNNITVNIEEISTTPSLEEIGIALNCEDPQDAKKHILKSIFNNPERPQNRSIVYPNKKKDDVLIRQNNVWELKSLKEEYTRIFNIARKLYTRRFEKLSNDIIKELLEVPEDQFKPELFDEKYEDYKEYYDKRRSENIYGLCIDFEYAVDCLLTKVCDIRKHY